MTARKLNRVQATEHLSQLLAEELTSISGRELEELARAWGIDPTESAKRVDAAFDAASKCRARARLDEAKRARERELANFSCAQRFAGMNRDTLLDKLTERLDELQRNNASRVTIQHRNLSELSDCDLVSLLGQLAELDRL